MELFRTNTNGLPTFELTEITTLDHEILDDTMELGTLVSHALWKGCTILANTGGKGAEVLYSLGNGLQCIELVYRRVRIW